MARKNEIVAVRGTSAFRKQLRSKVRAGLHTVHVVNTKSVGFPILVKIGTTYHALANGFTSANAAMQWCNHKLHRNPSTLVGIKFAA